MSANPIPPWRQGLIYAAQITIGLVLGYAALAKIGEIPELAREVRNFRLLPLGATNLLAMVLPWIELVAALALVLRIRVRAAALLATALLVVFTAAVASAMARGLNFECGCFGSASAARVGLTKLLQNIGLLILATIAVWPITPRQRVS